VRLAFERLGQGRGRKREWYEYNGIHPGELGVNDVVVARSWGLEDILTIGSTATSRMPFFFSSLIKASEMVVLPDPGTPAKAIKIRCVGPESFCRVRRRSTRSLSLLVVLSKSPSILR